MTPAPERLVLSGRLGPGAPDWVQLPFDVPDGVNLICVGLDYDRPDVPAGALTNACDLGIFGPPEGAHDGFRGWSGGARRGFELGTDHATPGYLPGPIAPGRWSILLGPYQVSAAGLAYRVEIELTHGPAVPAPRPGYPPQAVSGTGPGWYRGDCHLHSVYSDGSQTPEQIAARARAAGLDFIVSTEHNTPAAHGCWGPLAGDDLLIMTGEEVTTRNGHLVAIGLDPGSWIDWRFRARDDRLAAVVEQIHDRNGLAVAAHPHALVPAGRWKFGFEHVDLVEVWNGAWPGDGHRGGDTRSSTNESAVDTWDALLASPTGWRPAMGNSDSHSPDDLIGRAQTVVFADDLSRDAVLAGLRAGRSWVTDSSAVQLSLVVTAGAPDRTAPSRTAPDRTAGIGQTLEVAATTPVEVRAEVAGVERGSVRLISDEGELHRQPLGETGGGSVRWITTASLCSYVRLEVRHLDGTMAALTNPVFLRQVA